MDLTFSNDRVDSWSVRKIAVVGSGIVGVPMAALLAKAAIRQGSDKPAHVVALQRRSQRSGWKVDAINAGRSPIGGIEPALDQMIAEAVAAGRLSASHDYGAATDADIVLICVQTDRAGDAPSYGPLLEAITALAEVLQQRPEGQIPLVIFESTLAPSSMSTVIREHFKKYGLEDGRDLLLGNSPNRVMPGRLVERVVTSDKLVAGLQSVTPHLIARLYSRIVTGGTLHRTNSLTAEVVKTLENAYRDVRIAYATEIARHCDDHGWDYYRLRDEVNARLAQTDDASHDPNVVPSGGLLIPTLGVGGHCLPKDGILLWWRRLEHGHDTGRSLILEARRINDESPERALETLERRWGPLGGRSVALLGAAYRFNSEDTRNSPTLTLARLLRARRIAFTIHDPYVKQDDQNLQKFGLTEQFTNDLGAALRDAHLIVYCTAHRDYLAVEDALRWAPHPVGIFDACNLLPEMKARPKNIAYGGIGQGRTASPRAFADQVYTGFKAVERGVANELSSLIDFLNESYAETPFERIEFREVQRLAATCGTGCAIVDPGPVEAVAATNGLASRLVTRALGD
jgi:UDP-N-acetyl-D-mannosaminuronic acid dehydrogenase